MSNQYSLKNIDDSVLALYLKEISKYEILPNKEIIQLVKKAQAGDLQARNKVVESNLRYVVFVAKQYQGRGVPLMDLINEGNYGLIYSVNLFDTTRDVPFLGYASWWIRQAITQAIFWNGREIRLPVSQHVKIIAILRCIREFEQKYGHTPSTTEISKLTDIPESKIDFLSQYLNPIISIDSYIGGDEDHNQLCDVIPDTKITSVESTVDQPIISQKILEVLDKLSPREHDIVVLLYGIGRNPEPPQTVAKMFGLGTERVRQIKDKALRKLRSVYSGTLSSLI